ncbi:MAG TPA: hypothetical protein VK855_01865 [Thioalkalivibrio sp.]|nr:hypothetical protein [Thioalkalivibrio sp.]
MSPDHASPKPDRRAEWIAAAAIGGVVLLSSILFHPTVLILLPGAAALMVAGWGGYPWGRARALLWRLKWFYLSLLVFFGWMHPSVAVDSSQHWLPAAEGLTDAGTRIAALMLLVGWVVWLTSAFDRGTQIAGLTRWLAPLRPLGIRGEAFAGRLFLALADFESHHASYRAFRAVRAEDRWGRLKAGKEFLVRQLERALAGDMSQDERALAGPSAEREAGNRPLPLLIVQVGLLWAAVLASLLLRDAVRGQVVL